MNSLMHRSPRTAWLRGIALISWPVLTMAGVAAPTAPIVVQEAARPPYALRHAEVTVTVGHTVSRVVAAYDYIYVRAYDSKDRLDPLLIDVPVLVKAEDVAPATVIKQARIQLRIGRNAYQPHNVLVLDHEAFEPVPWLPDGVRLALVSYTIPRKSIKPRFRAHITYDQPHVSGADGVELCGLVPLLPDYEQLADVLHFKPDDFRVTFTALPEVRLRRETVNAHITHESPESLTIRLRHRETIAVAVQPRPDAPGAASPLAP
jgi:hypothetical protein